MSTTPEVPSTPTAYQNVVFRDGRPILNNEQEGVATTVVPASPRDALLKRILAGVVGTAGVLVTVLPEHTIGHRVAFILVAFGAALGITSHGVAPKK